MKDPFHIRLWADNWYLVYILLILTIQSGHYFAHVTVAQLCWHVQKLWPLYKHGSTFTPAQWSVGLHWRHNDQDSVSNHQPHGCLLNGLFRRRSKKTSKLRATGLCVGNSPRPVNSPHKWPVTRKMFPFDDVIMGWNYFSIPKLEWLYRWSLGLDKNFHPILYWM